MPKVIRRLGAATAVLSLVVGGLVVLTATEAGAATIDVPCGNNAALIGAINTANGNGNVEADVINITGAACTFTFTTPAVVSTPANNNVALPTISAPLVINGNGAALVRSTGRAPPRCGSSSASTPP